MWPPSKGIEWEYVDCIEPPATLGKSYLLQCKLCDKEFKASSITRV